MRRKHIKNILVVAVFFVLTFSMAYNVSGQFSYFYGKNKVIRTSFDWNHVETPHFKIYYYTKSDLLVKKIAAAAEAGYKSISEYLNVKVKKKIPLIFYSTHIDFELNNISGFLPQGVIAFAESNSYRVVIQGDESFFDLQRTITHELGHIFEYTVIGNKARYIRPPLWFMEGFSEFVTQHWNEFSLLSVRDGVLNGQIPTYTKSGQLGGPNSNNRSPYDWGHAVYEFIDEKFGKRGVKKLIFAARGGSVFRGGRRHLLKVLGYTPKMFNYEFGKYMRKRFKKFKTKENPEDYSYMIGPDFPYFYSFSHKISPSGEMLAILTANMKRRQLQILLISMKDGKVIKNLTPDVVPDWDSINLNFNPTGGNSFDWNKESNQIAFFVRHAWRDYLVVMDVLSGKMIKKIKINGIQNPTVPNFHPKERNMIYFTGKEATRSFIYSINLETKKIIKRTTGIMTINAIDIAPDGERVVYSAELGGHHKLYLGILANPEQAKQITFGEYNDITPAFSPDGKRIYYSSDELSSYNINSIDLEARKLFRYTDVMTGNFFPLEIPGEKNYIVMSSYFKGRFSLFKKDISSPKHRRDVEFETLDVAGLSKKDATPPEVEVKFLGKYKPLSKLYLKSLPPLAVSIGSDGGFYGYSYLSMSDLLGDQTFSLTLTSFYGYRSYDISYLNQKHRWQLYAHLFAFKDVYYYGYQASDYLTLRSMYGGEVGVFYPFSRSYRAELTASVYKQNEKSDSAFYGVELPYGQFFDGMAVPLRLSLVGETTRFQNYGPNRGHTFKLTFEKYLKFGGNFLNAYRLQGDVRKYIPLGSQALFAFRLNGFKSGGPNALLHWSGGNNSFRTAGFRRLVGHNMLLFTAEFRFPLVHAALTPLGLIGPVRGNFFFDVGAMWFNGQKVDIWQKDADGKRIFRLDEPLSSMGFGMEFFLFGYPMHVEWTWRTDWKQKAYHGVNFWIGYDF